MRTRLNRILFVVALMLGAVATLTRPTPAYADECKPCYDDPMLVHKLVAACMLDGWGLTDSPHDWREGECQYNHTPCNAIKPNG